MKLAHIFLLLFVFLFSSSFVAQDKIQLMNGKVLRGKLKAEFDDYYQFDYFKNGGKSKSLELSKYRIYAVTNSSGEESILYKQDSTIGNFFTPTEMKMFIYGQRDGHKTFKGSPMFISGFALGFASVLIDTYEFSTTATSPQGFFNRTPSVAPIALPLVFTIGAGLIKTKIRKEQVTDISFLSSELYIDGFHKVSKTKRVKSAFFGSISGLVVGFLVYNFAQ
jgi:hypothetical protein